MNSALGGLRLYLALESSGHLPLEAGSVLPLFPCFLARSCNGHVTTGREPGGHLEAVFAASGDQHVWSNNRESPGDGADVLSPFTAAGRGVPEFPAGVAGGAVSAVRCLPSGSGSPRDREGGRLLGVLPSPPVPFLPPNLPDG